MERVEVSTNYEDHARDLEVMFLEGKLGQVNRQLAQALDRNDKLVIRLAEARDQVTSLKDEVDKLCAPPATYGMYLFSNADGTVNVLSQGRKVKVNLRASIKAADIKSGQELILNVAAGPFTPFPELLQGRVVCD
jgi:hypothetical protein